MARHVGLNGAAAQSRLSQRQGRRRRAPANVQRLVLTTLPLLLASCGAPTLLDNDALPGATETSDGSDGAPGGGWCAALNEAQVSFSAHADGAAGTQYTLANSNVVGATVFRPGGRYPSVAAMRAAIRDAADKCRAGLADGPYANSTIKPLSGLPGGAFGYRLESSAFDPRRTSEQAYAETSDGRFLTVGIEHAGPGEPSVDVASLLKDAQRRAPDMDAN